MKPEKIHDALNHLDEDIIEEVSALRDRPKRSKRLWMRYVSLAACFCILLTGVIIASNKGLFDNSSVIDTPSADMENEETLPENVTDDHNKLDQSISNEHYAEDESAGSDNFDTESIPDSTERPGLLVRIDEWSEDGFSATVAEMIDTDVYPVDAEVYVRFEDNIDVVVPSNEGYVHEQRTPDKEEFPEGSRVLIQFRDSGEKINGKILLYANMIHDMTTVLEG